MRRYFIAKAPLGKEYIYSRDTAMFVSKKNKNIILQFLNKERYNLKDGETWHVYENDYYTNSFIYKEIKIRKNGQVYIRYNIY